MRDFNFPKDFLWGAATASYQVEGAIKEDMRGPSIWDTFCEKPGKVYAGESGAVAVDQYHRYQEDIDLMKDLNLKSYRFSIAWPRIFPNGRGKVNPKGFVYYDKLVDALLKAGIEPAVTLYHWDLPQVLEDEGGWVNRETAYAFRDYAIEVFKHFNGRVKNWITLNEPWCSSYLGYDLGIHAPGRTNRKDALFAIHHLNLAHGLAVEAFRAQSIAGVIGITLNLSTPRSATLKESDIEAAELATEKDSKMFTSPIFHKEYPKKFIAQSGITLPVEKGDMDLISQKIDFLGLNYYTESAIRANKNSTDGCETVFGGRKETDMGWPVIPEGLIRQLRWVNKETNGIPLYITENGAAYTDLLINGRVQDSERVAYMHKHLSVCAEAIQEGIPLKGYYAWSLIDNFEWALGYTKRFGIIYCDFSNLKRIPKDSYYYYRDIISGFSD